MKNRTFDAFGTEVFVGDWVYYTRNPNIMYIGKIESLNYDGSNYATLKPFTNEDIFQMSTHFFSGSTTLDVSFIKCCNQALIDTLEELIK